MRGWLAAVHRIHDPRRQIPAYFGLRQLFRFFATWDVLAWSDEAADRFLALRQAKVRIGTMDLKIAGICVANDATLLSANLNDFENVPNLRIENWLA